MSAFIDILSPGEQLPSTVQPDNKSSFTLTQEEVAFVNVINMQLDMLKTVTVSVIAHMESQMETHTKMLEDLKNQFVLALAKKHGIDAKPGSFSVDLSNKLFLHSKDDE
ncbi:MAG: hypothetical protein ACK5DE_01850 [Bacteroidota bacterium]|jgi:hypothetical protein